MRPLILTLLLVTFSLPTPHAFEDDVRPVLERSCVKCHGGEKLKGKVDFHGFNLAYHVGTPITLSGNSSERDGQLVLTKVTDHKSVFGNSKPGKANG